MTRPGRRRAVSGVALLGAALLGASCAPQFQPVGSQRAAPRLASTRMVARDGAALPVRRWLPAGRVRAVIVGVHGMNDYANAFAGAAGYWRTRGIATYAFDQRGFGRTRHRGRWAGVAQMRHDLADIARLVRRRHPGVPVVAVGTSMGGGVVLAALGGPDPPRIDGAALVAPAVWSRETMPWLYRATLALAAHTIPAIWLSPGGLRRLPTDNIALLRRLGRDPHMIQGARIDTLFGVVNLMDAAAKAAPRMRVRTLLLYGERDEIIPRKPIRVVIAALPAARTRVAVYREGWHMLLRDLQARVVLEDVASWVLRPRAPLPSGADRPGAVRRLALKRPKRPAALRKH